MFAPEDPWPVFSRAFRCHFDRTLVLIGRSIRVADDISFSNDCKDDIMETSEMHKNHTIEITSLVLQQLIKVYEHRQYKRGVKN